MSYQDSLRPWVIYQLLPNCQRLTVDRFRRRSEADNYLRVLQRLQPPAECTIVFEVEEDLETDHNPSDELFLEAKLEQNGNNSQMEIH